MNTSEFLMIASSIVPERTAMVCESKNRTFAQMQERVNRLANALQGLGVGQGDKIAVMALNSMEYVEIYYATAKLGGVFVPLNYRAKREELTYMCNNSAATVLFVSERYFRARRRHSRRPGDGAAPRRHRRDGRGGRPSTTTCSSRTSRRRSSPTSRTLTRPSSSTPAVLPRCRRASCSPTSACPST